MFPEGRTLIFAFEPPACRDLATFISQGKASFLELRSSEAAIRQFVCHTLDDYDHIFGIGISKQLHMPIRFERVFVNKFKNRPIMPSGPKYLFNLDSTDIKSGNSITWSYCNLVSFLFIHRILAGELRATYHFLHINPRYGTTEEMAVGLHGSFHSESIRVG